VTTLRHHGNYGARFTSNGGNYERSCSYEKIGPFDELYARGYFYVSESGITLDDDSLYFIIFDNGSGDKDANLAYAGWRMSAGATRWCLTLRNGTSYLDVYSSSGPLTGRWYCIELHWRNDASAGLAELWVDGNPVCSSAGVNTSAYGGAGTIKFGLAEIDGGNAAVYCDCVEINTAYVGPEPVPSLGFQDDFESGSFSAWSGENETDGEAASATVAPLQREGTYCAEFRSNGGGSFENAYCYREIGASELYARGYFYVSQSGIDAENDRFFFIVFRAGVNGLAYAGWKRTAGVTKWCITMRDGTTYPDVFSSTSPTVGRWYCVELHWKKDPSAGLAEMWVDGVLVCSSSNRNTSAYDDVTTVQVGLAELYGCQTTTVYADSFETSDTYIGPELFPSRPNLIAPIDGASLTSTTVSFSWTSSVGATDYQIRIDGSVNRLVIVSGTSLTVTLSAGSYNWSVRDHSASGGWSEWAPQRIFTIGVPPLTPNPVSPADSTTFTSTSISISWTSSPGATYYQVNIAGQQNRLDAVSATSYEVTLSVGSYSWSVRAYNASGWSGWSATRAFTIIVSHVPLPPSLVAPPNSTNSTNPSVAFSWTSSSGATLYQVEVNGPSPILGNTSMTSYVATLAPGSYTWRVRAYNASGWSDWSVARTLTVQAQPEPIPWWIYLGIIAATMVIVLLLLLRIRSRRPTLGTNDDDDTKIYR
jgi:hypothetical protein